MDIIVGENLQNDEEHVLGLALHLEIISILMGSESRDNSQEQWRSELGSSSGGLVRLWVQSRVYGELELLTHNHLENMRSDIRLCKR